MILRKKSDLARHYGCSETTVQNWTKKPLFPREPDGSFCTLAVDYYLWWTGSPYCPGMCQRAANVIRINLEVHWELVQWVLGVLPEKVRNKRVAEEDSTVGEILEGFRPDDESSRLIEDDLDYIFVETRRGMAKSRKSGTSASYRSTARSNH